MPTTVRFWFAALAILGSSLGPGVHVAVAGPEPQAPCVRPDPACEMRARYGAVSTIKAEFVQTTRNPIYGDETQTGRLVLQRPSRIRWEVSGDGRQFVSDGKTMWMYAPADKQVIRTQGFAPPSTSAMSLLHSLDRLGELFELTEVEGEGRIFSLTPRTADEGVRSVRLELDDALVMRRLVVSDSMGSVTELTFAKVELDPVVDPAVFTFTVPPGVEVIDAG